jgi:hypothetical protein
LGEKTQRVPYPSSRNLADVPTSGLYFSLPVLKNGFVNHNHRKGYFFPCFNMSGLRTNFGSENFHVIVETKQFIQLFCSNLVFLSFKILFNSLLAVKLKLCPLVESLQLLLASFLLVYGFDYLVPIIECFCSITLHDRICLYKVNLVSWWLDIFFLDIELIYSFLWHFCNFVRNNRCKVGGSLSYVAISSKSQVSGISN